MSVTEMPSISVNPLSAFVAHVSELYSNFHPELMPNKLIRIAYMDRLEA